MLNAFIPLYSAYWWYRTAGDLSAFGEEQGDDNVRVSPVLIVVLVLLFGGLLPLILASVLVTQATRTAQARVHARSRISPPVMALALTVAWATGPVMVLIALASGASVGGVLLVAALGVVVWRTLVLVTFEAFQHELNTIWTRYRPLARS